MMGGLMGRWIWVRRMTDPTPPRSAGCQEDFRDGFVFADPNGDGCAEYLYVFGNGSITAWPNLSRPNSGPDAAQVG